MDSQTILSILERASYFSSLIKSNKPIPKLLSEKVVANLFFENSTRTKFSFEIAAKRLGAQVLNFNGQSSSLTKGETLDDTLKTFDALGIDIGIIRHSDDHYIEEITDRFSFSVINAGAGKFEHPSQSLLDLYTIKEQFGTLENLTVAICGDVGHSRVAKSNIAALEKFNSKVILSGPEQFMPDSKTLPSHCRITDIDSACKEADVVMLLRVQHERHDLYEMNVDRYNKEYGLSDERIKLLKDKAIFMHPGPFNRDVEISSHLVEHDKSRIFKQKENGVYTRMSILEWISNE